MPNINADILIWARETAGLTPQDAVEKLKIRNVRGVAAVDRLLAMERGDEHPTRPMLVKMAKQYRRPLLIFYLPAVPRRGDRGEDFRTLPDHPVADSQAAIVDAVVRDIRVRQSLVRAALESANEAQRLPFIESKKHGDSVATVVASIEHTIGFERDVFRGSGGGIPGAFGYLRSVTEQAGVFVLFVDNLGSRHTKVNVDIFRGFALADDVAPFIAINADDSPGAWSFTLAHELAHLWIGASGVSDDTAERKIEKFCNDVASELLLRRADLAPLNVTESTSFENAFKHISEFAKAHNVSSTMVAYKLFRVGAFSRARFEQLKAAYRNRFRDHKKSRKESNADKRGGPNYYEIRKHRVGTTLIGLVERMMYDGDLSVTKAGKVLGVGAHNVHALLEYGRPHPSGLEGGHAVSP